MTSKSRSVCVFAALFSTTLSLDRRHRYSAVLHALSVACGVVCDAVMIISEAGAQWSSSGNRRGGKPHRQHLLEMYDAQWGLVKQQSRARWGDSVSLCACPVCATGVSSPLYKLCPGAPALLEARRPYGCRLQRTAWCTGHADPHCIAPLHASRSS